MNWFIDIMRRLAVVVTLIAIAFGCHTLVRVLFYPEGINGNQATATLIAAGAFIVQVASLRKE